MNGLFIPDAELPEDCVGCPCCNDERGFCMATKDHRHVFIDKPEWCPLIEVMLVDANEP